MSLAASGGEGWSSQLSRPASIRPLPSPRPAVGSLSLTLRAERVEALPPTLAGAVLGPVLPELVVSGFVRLAPLWRWLAALE